MPAPYAYPDTTPEGVSIYCYCPHCTDEERGDHLPKILNDRVRTRTQVCVVPKHLLLNVLAEHGLNPLTVVSGEGVWSCPWAPS